MRSPPRALLSANLALPLLFAARCLASLPAPGAELVVPIPTAPWGVSHKLRPRLRAPRFDEAAFDVDAGSTGVAVDVQVAR